MRLLSAMALMLLAISTAFAQRSDTFLLTIKATDMTGAWIPNATVSISPASAAASNAPNSIILKTGHGGTVSAKLKPGIYNISVAASGFTTTWYQQVRLHKSLSLTVKLRVAPTFSPRVILQRPTLSPTSTPLHQLVPDLIQTPERVPVTLQVIDVTGAPVPYAEMLLIPSPSSTLWPGIMEADRTGHLALNLMQGEHSIAVYSPGFKRLEEHFEVNGPMTIPLKLTVGGCTECVTVYRLTPEKLLLRTTPFHGIPPVVLGPSELKALPHTTVSIHNPHTNADETYSGVPLIDLIEKIGVAHGRLLSSDAYIVATGSDGYKAVLSLAEVDPEFHPGKVIVADEMNGRPLNAKIGAFELIVTEDKLPLRSVRHLVSIDVRHAE